jgi:hypothetical protein
MLDLPISLQYTHTHTNTHTHTTVLEYIHAVVIASNRSTNTTIYVIILNIHGYIFLVIDNALKICPERRFTTLLVTFIMSLGTYHSIWYHVPFPGRHLLCPHIHLLCHGIILLLHSLGKLLTCPGGLVLCLGCMYVDIWPCLLFSFTYVGVLYYI